MVIINICICICIWGRHQLVAVLHCNKSRKRLKMENLKRMFGRSVSGSDGQAVGGWAGGQTGGHFKCRCQVLAAVACVRLFYVLYQAWMLCCVEVFALCIRLISTSMSAICYKQFEQGHIRSQNKRRLVVWSVCRNG